MLAFASHMLKLEIRRGPPSLPKREDLESGKERKRKEALAD